MKDVAKYIFESGELKRVKRSGWWTSKVKDPESVAEHTFRTALIAFILAKMEKMDEKKLCCAALFHDMHETRTLDLHKIHARYAKLPEDTKRKVVEDQLENLPEEVRKSIGEVYALSEKEKILLKDADLLECAFQAKEYLEIGYRDCENWIANITKLLKTDSAKKLLDVLKTTDSKEWWKGLKLIGDDRGYKS